MTESGGMSAAPSARGERLEAAEGLLDALLVLDEGEPHEALAVLAEADAGRHGDLALVDQELRELEGAHGAERLGNGRPYEHGAPGLRHAPSALVEAVHEDVPPLAVEFHDLLHDTLLALEGHDGSDLDRLESAVVEVGLDAGQSVDH